MRRIDVVDVFDRIPEVDHAKVQVVLRAGRAVSVETILRLEENYAVFRGREAGNQDEGRAFFVPYDEIICCKLERLVQMDEVETWYSDLPALARKDGVAHVPAAAAEPQPLDPAEIARQNLLERIRAARSVVVRK